jgi:hypothetical protein
MLHVCLAGPGIAGHRALIDELRIRHEVTLVSDQTRLERSWILDTSHVLVLDAAGIRATFRSLLRSLRQRRPELPIVLVDGGLSDAEKADAFSLGVLDYFPAGSEVGLLAERVELLARERLAGGPDAIPTS